MKKKHARPYFLFVLLSTLLIGSAAVCTAQEEALGQSPPRLSLADGRISFWRPGAKKWTQAQINTPLAPGDQLYIGSPGDLELQIASGAFVRAGEQTRLGYETQEPDFLAFKLTAGVAGFDLRAIAPGHTLEVDTPNAAFTIEHVGYYRVEVNGDRTTFIARRAGEATLTPSGGEAVHIARGEEVVVEGADNAPTISFTAAPPDRWDKWNYARTDKLLDAVSTRYVSPDVYGLADLDSAGTWRVVPTYGGVWIPSGVPAGWAPYTTGSWIRDPDYGWTWVDTAPWGWAPYHYGRWVHAEGHWCWAPGPWVDSPRYAPALVAFLGSNRPDVAWVALGWGEPLVPWWGPPAFRHRPWWGGWHGPRFVNGRAVRRTAAVRVVDISVYRNLRVRHGVVGVPERYFGRGRITRKRLAHIDAYRLRPVQPDIRIRATPASFAPRTERGFRPPDRILPRTVVATRPPRYARELFTQDKGFHHPHGRTAASPRIVSVTPPHGLEHRQRTSMERFASEHPRRPEPGKFGWPHPPLRTYETFKRRSPARPRAAIASGPRAHKPVAKRSLESHRRPWPPPVSLVRGPKTTEGEPVHPAVRRLRELSGKPASRISPRQRRLIFFRQPIVHEAPHVSVQRKPAALSDRRRLRIVNVYRNNRPYGRAGRVDPEQRTELGTRR